MLPWFPVWSTAMAAEKHGYVVRPDQAARFLGPAGMEGLITEVLATREQTGGAFAIWRYEIEPKAGPPCHIHREKDEFCYVLSMASALGLGCMMVAGRIARISRKAYHRRLYCGHSPHGSRRQAPKGKSLYAQERPHSLDEGGNSAVVRQEGREVYYWVCTLRRASYDYGFQTRLGWTP
jgi:hypothetical protein